LGAALFLGLLAGAAVSVLAFYLARYGPSGEGWSFRGNGALAAYTVVPAILAAGWSAVIAYYRGRSRTAFRAWRGAHRPRARSG